MYTLDICGVDMVIVFLGHSYYLRKAGDMELTLSLICKCVEKEDTVRIFIGGYGSFDSFAYECACAYKLINRSAQIVFVTPYLDEVYQRNKICDKKYDEILYPPIEATPLRYAISKRNKWMVENSDIIISYVAHTWGGAHKACEYAKRKGKRVYNIFEREK